MSQLDKEVLKLCEEMRACDDSHGMYSDHEGDKSGPTWSLWQEGYEDFKLYCQRALADHQQGIFLWKQLAELNEKRKP